MRSDKEIDSFSSNLKKAIGYYNQCTCPKCEQLAENLSHVLGILDWAKGIPSKEAVDIENIEELVAKKAAEVIAS